MPSIIRIRFLEVPGVSIIVPKCILLVVFHCPYRRGGGYWRSLGLLDFVIPSNGGSAILASAYNSLLVGHNDLPSWFRHLVILGNTIRSISHVVATNVWLTEGTLLFERLRHHVRIMSIRTICCLASVEGRSGRTKGWGAILWTPIR